MIVWCWYALMTGAVLLWPLALVAGRMFFPQHPWAPLICILAILIVHASELPAACPIGRARGLSRTRILIKTLIFGFTWWVPLKKGVVTN